MDFDGDGTGDILSGCWPGELYFFKGLGKGQFAGKETLKDKAGKNIKIESASTVWAADWNGDSKLDLLIGDVQGRVHLMLNEGSAGTYVFGKSQQLSADGAPIQVTHGDSHPIAVDWDGDKVLDLLVGCGDGSVLFYKNTGSATEPKLARPQTLVAVSRAPGEINSAQAIHPGMRTKICVVDWNGDGRPDLLTGDFCQYQAKIEIPEKDRKAVEAARKKKDELMKSYLETQKDYLDFLQGTRKKETPEEAEARNKKLEEISEKYQDLFQDFQQDLSKLAKLEGLAERSAEQQKEAAALRKKLDALRPKFIEAMTAMLPYQSAPLDEPAEKTKARMEKMKARFEKQFSFQIELALLQEIIRPYESNQMAGSVWLYLREKDPQK